MTQTQKTLPADVYDYLELSALAEGGIGAGTFSRTKDDGTRTCNCIHGHSFVEYAGLAPGESGEVISALYGADITYAANDEAVERINKGLAAAFDWDLVPWDLYVKELNIVRGD